MKLKDALQLVLSAANVRWVEIRDEKLWTDDDLAELQSALIALDAYAESLDGDEEV